VTSLCVLSILCTQISRSICDFTHSSNNHDNNNNNLSINMRIYTYQIKRLSASKKAVDLSPGRGSGSVGIGASIGGGDDVPTMTMVGSECSCDVYFHLRSPHSAHANLTLYQYASLYYRRATVLRLHWRRGGTHAANLPYTAWRRPCRFTVSTRC
jgi:hypothetical protein